MKYLTSFLDLLIAHSEILSSPDELTTSNFKGQQGRTYEEYTVVQRALGLPGQNW